MNHNEQKINAEFFVMLNDTITAYLEKVAENNQHNHNKVDDNLSVDIIADIVCTLSVFTGRTLAFFHMSVIEKTLMDTEPKEQLEVLHKAFIDIMCNHIKDTFMEYTN